MSREEAEFAKEAYKLHMKGIDAKHSKTAENALAHYEFLYNDISSRKKLVSEHIYQEDMSEIRENYESLAKEEWYSKADKILEKFYSLYSIITDPCFGDVEKAYRSKKKCIEYWQEYFASIPDDTGVWYDAKTHMKDKLGFYYDDCMYTHEALEKKLSRCIEEMKPEYKRKLLLREQIIGVVAENGSIQRSKLLSIPFDGCTAKEVECCMKELLEAYRIVSLKIGSRYFVSLSDKEKAKRQENAPTVQKSCVKKEDQEMIIDSPTLIRDMLIRHCLDNHLEYIDMTERGGGFYFFDEDTSRDLAAKGYEVRYAPNGTKNTSNRPAWYLTLQ